MGDDVGVGLFDDALPASAELLIQALYGLIGVAIGDLDRDPARLDVEGVFIEGARASRSRLGAGRLVRERAKDGDVRIRGCRHSATSRGLALGENPPIVGGLLGHVPARRGRGVRYVGGNMPPRICYAHSSPSAENQHGWQRLSDHLKGTAERASRFLEVTGHTELDRAAGRT